MIRLNRYYSFDIVGLANYLHIEATKGHHIQFISQYLLIFKMGQPTNDYFVIPKSHKINGKKIISTNLDYPLYRTSEEIAFTTIPKEANFYTIMNFLIGIIMVLFTYCTITTAFFYSDSATMFRKIVVTLLLISLVFTNIFRTYKRKIIKESTIPVLKTTWDFCMEGIVLLLIIAAIIIANGLNIPVLISNIGFLILGYIFITSKVNLVLVCIILTSFNTNLSVKYNGPNLSQYFNTPMDIIISQRDQTIFASYEWVIAFNGDKEINYQYYAVANDWIEDKLVNYLDTKVKDNLEQFKILHIDGFNNVSKRINEYSQTIYYSFKKDKKVLNISVDNIEESQLIEFVKARMEN